MIRVRRLRPRFPIGKLYELEYRPEADGEAGFHGVSRSPVDYLTPVLGYEAAVGAVQEADRQWDEKNTHWAVERDETLRPIGDAWDPRDDGRLPRTGWWLLIPHMAWVALGAWSYLDAARASQSDDNGMAEGIAWLVMLAPAGLPWSIGSFFAIPFTTTVGDDDGASPNNDPEVLAVTLGPALLNVVLHVLYRWRRHRRIQALKRPEAGR